MVAVLDLRFEVHALHVSTLPWLSSCTRDASPCVQVHAWTCHYYCGRHLAQLRAASTIINMKRDAQPLHAPCSAGGGSSAPDVVPISVQAEVPDDFGGPPTLVELCPDGPSVPVTADNREQYVQAYTHHLLASSVSRQYEAFARGFKKVCPALVGRAWCWVHAAGGALDEPELQWLRFWASSSQCWAKSSSLAATIC